MAFRSSIAWLSDWLSTLRRTGYPRTTQDSLPAAGQALPDGLSTRRTPTKGFRFAFYISSPFPKLAWRNPTRRSCETDPAKIWRNTSFGATRSVFPLLVLLRKRWNRLVQQMPCRRLCVGALALHGLCVVARSLAGPQEEQGDQRDDWGDAGDGKAGIVRMSPVHDLSKHRLHR